MFGVLIKLHSSSPPPRTAEVSRQLIAFHTGRGTQLVIIWLLALSSSTTLRILSCCGLLLGTLNSGYSRHSSRGHTLVGILLWHSTGYVFGYWHIVIDFSGHLLLRFETSCRIEIVGLGNQPPLATTPAANLQLPPKDIKDITNKSACFA